jgi:hypothetical protein
LLHEVWMVIPSQNEILFWDVHFPSIHPSTANLQERSCLKTSELDGEIQALLCKFLREPLSFWAKWRNFKRKIFFSVIF